MLPRSCRTGWTPVADAEPNTRSLAFQCIWDGVQVVATATARHGQIDLTFVPGKTVEIPLDVWRGMAPWLTAAALTRRPDPS